jgi:hypothetical protein
VEESAFMGNCLEKGKGCNIEGNIDDCKMILDNYCVIIIMMGNGKIVLIQYLEPDKLLPLSMKA